MFPGKFKNVQGLKIHQKIQNRKKIAPGPIKASY